MAPPTSTVDACTAIHAHIPWLPRRRSFFHATHMFKQVKREELGKDKEFVYMSGDDSEYEIGPSTELRFIYHSYRVLICIDCSSSVSVFDSQLCKPFSAYWLQCIQTCLQQLVQPISSGGVRPKLWVHIVAVDDIQQHKRDLTNGELISIVDPFLLTADTLTSSLANIEFRLFQLENYLASTHAAGVDGRGGCRVSRLLRYSLFSLSRMPMEGCPCVLFVTDGVLQLPERSASYQSLIRALQRRDISVSFLVMCDLDTGYRHSLGYVPNVDILRYMASVTGGVCSSLAHGYGNGHISFMHDMLIRLSPLCTSDSGTASSTTAQERLKICEYRLAVSAKQLLFVRESEGFQHGHMKDLDRGRLQVELKQEWRQGMFISYALTITHQALFETSIISPSRRHHDIHVVVHFSGPRDFTTRLCLLQQTLWSNQAPLVAGGGTSDALASFRQFRAFIASVMETDKHLIRVHSLTLDARAAQDRDMTGAVDAAALQRMRWRQLRWRRRRRKGKHERTPEAPDTHTWHNPEQLYSILSTQSVDFWRRWFNVRRMEVLCAVGDPGVLGTRCLPWESGVDERRSSVLQCVSDAQAAIVSKTVKGVMEQWASFVSRADKILYVRFFSPSTPGLCVCRVSFEGGFLAVLALGFFAVSPDMQEQCVQSLSALLSSTPCVRLAGRETGIKSRHHHHKYHHHHKHHHHHHHSYHQRMCPPVVLPRGEDDDDDDDDDDSEEVQFLPFHVLAKSCAGVLLPGSRYSINRRHSKRKSKRSPLLTGYIGPSAVPHMDLDQSQESYYDSVSVPTSQNHSPDVEPGDAITSHVTEHGLRSVIKPLSRGAIECYLQSRTWTWTGVDGSVLAFCTEFIIRRFLSLGFVVACSGEHQVSLLRQAPTRSCVTRTRTRGRSKTNASIHVVDVEKSDPSPGDSTVVQLCVSWCGSAGVRVELCVEASDSPAGVACPLFADLTRFVQWEVDTILCSVSLLSTLHHHAAEILPLRSSPPKYPRRASKTFQGVSPVASGVVEFVAGNEAEEASRMLEEVDIVCSTDDCGFNSALHLRSASPIPVLLHATRRVLPSLDGLLRLSSAGHLCVPVPFPDVNLSQQQQADNHNHNSNDNGDDEQAQPERTSLEAMSALRVESMLRMTLGHMCTHQLTPRVFFRCQPLHSSNGGLLSFFILSGKQQRSTHATTASNTSADSTASATTAAAAAAAARGSGGVQEALHDKLDAFLAKHCHHADGGVHVHVFDVLQSDLIPDHCRGHDHVSPSVRALLELAPVPGWEGYLPGGVLRCESNGTLRPPSERMTMHLNVLLRRNLAKAVFIDLRAGFPVAPVSVRAAMESCVALNHSVDLTALCGANAMAHENVALELDCVVELVESHFCFLPEVEVYVYTGPLANEPQDSGAKSDSGEEAEVKTRFRRCLFESVLHSAQQLEREKDQDEDGDRNDVDGDGPLSKFSFPLFLRLFLATRAGGKEKDGTRLWPLNASSLADVRSSLSQHASLSLQLSFLTLPSYHPNHTSRPLPLASPPSSPRGVSVSVGGENERSQDHSPRFLVMSQLPRSLRPAATSLLTATRQRVSRLVLQSLLRVAHVPGKVDGGVIELVIRHLSRLPVCEVGGFMRTVQFVPVSANGASVLPLLTTEILQHGFHCVSLRRGPIFVAHTDVLQLGHTPRCWLLLSLESIEGEDVLSVVFHKYDMDADQAQQLEQTLQEGISTIVDTVNRRALLQELHETRTCSPYLVPPREDESTMDSPPKTTRKAKAPVPRFHAGQFSCDSRWSMSFALHPRLSSYDALRSLSSAALNPFIVSNRSNLFVYEQEKGQIFYFKCSVAHSKKMSDSLNARSRAPSTSSNSARTSMSRISSVANMVSFGDFSEGPASASISDVHELVIEFFGVDESGPGIKSHLHSHLQSSIRAVTLSKITQLLIKNPKFKLSVSDHAWMRGREEAPCRAFAVPLPQHVHDPFLFLMFLRAALLKFLNPLLLQSAVPASLSSLPSSQCTTHVPPRAADAASEVSDSASPRQSRRGSASRIRPHPSSPTASTTSHDTVAVSRRVPQQSLAFVYVHDSQAQVLATGKRVPPTPEQARVGTGLACVYCSLSDDVHCAAVPSRLLRVPAYLSAKVDEDNAEHVATCSTCMVSLQRSCPVLGPAEKALPLSRLPLSFSEVPCVPGGLPLLHPLEEEDGLLKESDLNAAWAASVTGRYEARSAPYSRRSSLEPLKRSLSRPESCSLREDSSHTRCRSASELPMYSPPEPPLDPSKLQPSPSMPDLTVVTEPVEDRPLHVVVELFAKGDVHDSELAGVSKTR